MEQAREAADGVEGEMSWLSQRWGLRQHSHLLNSLLPRRCRSEPLSEPLSVSGRGSRTLIPTGSVINGQFYKSNRKSFPKWGPHVTRGDKNANIFVQPLLKQTGKFKKGRNICMACI